MPFAAGGALDIMARFLAQDLSNRLRQRVLVENRVGAAGDIGAAAVARSPQDGHTLLLGTNAPIIVNKILRSGPGSFDPETTLTPHHCGRNLGANDRLVLTTASTVVREGQDRFHDQCKMN